LRVVFLTKASTKVSTARQWFYQMHDLLLSRGLETALNTFEQRNYDVAIIHWCDHELIQKVLDHSPRAHIGILNPGLAPPEEIVGNVDFFIVTSFMWRELLLPYDRRIYLHFDYDSPEGKSIKRHTEKNGLILGYHGNEIHYAKDFFPHIANALRRLAREHDVILKVVINNAASQPHIEGVETQFVEWELETYEEHIKSFDIGLCPAFSNLSQLAEPNTYIRTPNRVNTLLFYGIPSIASPLPQSCQSLKDGETALFAVSEEGWYDALKRLITQPDLRNRIGEAGHDIVAARFSEDAAADSFIDLLRAEMGMPVFPKKGFKVVAHTERSRLSELLLRSYQFLRRNLSMVNKSQ
jgi:glycosyltransferase involved in cell wall biosynthesis